MTIALRNDSCVGLEHAYLNGACGITWEEYMLNVENQADYSVTTVPFSVNEHDTSGLMKRRYEAFSTNPTRRYRPRI
jgi:hypothetical protein